MYRHIGCKGTNKKRDSQEMSLVFYSKVYNSLHILFYQRTRAGLGFLYQSEERMEFDPQVLNSG